MSYPLTILSHSRQLLLVALLFALTTSGCQSISSYAPLCDLDEDCQPYQQCDTSLGACVLSPSYRAETCDLAAEFDRCPTATSCNAEAEACLPRKLRIAWVFSFNSTFYSRRQATNMIKTLTEYVSETYFTPLSCESAEGIPHINLRCSNDHIEYLFLDTGDETDTYSERIQEAYKAYPFDIAMPFFSSGYSFVNDFKAEHDLDFFTLGRVNRRADRVLPELELNYVPPIQLNERQDVSLTPLGQSYHQADFFFNKLGCKTPLMIHDDREPYKLDRLIYSQVWPKFGHCMDALVIPRDIKASYPELTERLTTKDYDCIYLHQTGEWLDALLQEYVDNVKPGETMTPTWIMSKLSVNTGNEVAIASRRIIEQEFPEHVYVSSSQSTVGVYEGFVSRLEPVYRDFLNQEGCLGNPENTCEDLQCDTSADALTQQACQALDCVLKAELKSCLELRCLSDDVPEYCERLKCPPIESTCDYWEPTYLRNGSSTISTISDQVILSQLMALQYAARPVEQLPMSKDELRTYFLSMTREAPACDILDIEKCKRLIDQSTGTPSFQYVGLRGILELDDGGRLTQTNSTTVYERFDGARFFEPLAYSASQKRMIRQDGELLEPTVMCDPDPDL